VAAERQERRLRSEPEQRQGGDRGGVGAGEVAHEPHGRRTDRGSQAVRGEEHPEQATELLDAEERAASTTGLNATNPP